MEHLKNNKNSSTILSSDINIILDDNTSEDPDENKKEIPDLEYLNKNNNIKWNKLKIIKILRQFYHQI